MKIAALSAADGWNERYFIGFGNGDIILRVGAVDGDHERPDLLKGRITLFQRAAKGANRTSVHLNDRLPSSDNVLGNTKRLNNISAHDFINGFNRPKYQNNDDVPYF